MGRPTGRGWRQPAHGRAKHARTLDDLALAASQDPRNRAPAAGCRRKTGQASVPKGELTTTGKEIVRCPFAGLLSGLRVANC